METHHRGSSVQPSGHFHKNKPDHLWTQEFLSPLLHTGYFLTSINCLANLDFYYIWEIVLPRRPKSQLVLNNWLKTFSVHRAHPSLHLYCTFFHEAFLSIPVKLFLISPTFEQRACLFARCKCQVILGQESPEDISPTRFVRNNE